MRFEPKRGVEGDIKVFGHEREGKGFGKAAPLIKIIHYQCIKKKNTATSTVEKTVLLLTLSNPRTEILL